MRALDALLVLVLLTAWVAGFVVLVRRLGSRRAPRWRVGVHTRDDGTMVVQLERPGEAPRTLRELPPGMDAVEFESDLRLAVEDGEAQAAALNRR
jgi:hypothetical protein